MSCFRERENCVTCTSLATCQIGPGSKKLWSATIHSWRRECISLKSVPSATWRPPIWYSVNSVGLITIMSDALCQEKQIIQKARDQRRLTEMLRLSTCLLAQMRSRRISADIVKASHRWLTCHFRAVECKNANGAALKNCSSRTQVSWNLG